MCDRINQNSRVHDLIAPLYEARHGEIFNQTEQGRIHELLRQAIAGILTGSSIPRVLDFGAGTGNLTRHLLDLGTVVVASDVSAGCLRELQSSVPTMEHLEISHLNGRDLSQFPDQSFDMVATYSVLHHVPDYLAIVNEFIRVVKPGGVIYIDHEVCPEYWQQRSEYREYCHEVALSAAELTKPLFERLANIFRQNCWWRYLLSAFRVQLHKVSDEGDIHVHPEDHIEWPKIKNILEPMCEIFHLQDYLVCRERTLPPPVWEKWHNRCVDMRLLVARKR